MEKKMYLFERGNALLVFKRHDSKEWSAKELTAEQASRPLFDNCPTFLCRNATFKGVTYGGRA